jgi:Inner membrane protein YgaP-like, transmembrane domain
MRKNIGTADRVIRILAAVVLGFFVLNGTITGVLAWILGAFAVILLLTSFVSFCPLYAPFKITTMKKTGATSH